MNPLLDDWLDGQSTDVLKSKRRCLKFLKQAYAVCVGDFANKPRADVLMTDGGFRFHVGTPLPDLRHIASWMITRAPRQRTLARTIRRFGSDTEGKMSALLASFWPTSIRLNWDKTRGWRSSTSHKTKGAAFGRAGGC